VTFENRQGHRLFGILHEPPDGGRSDLGIILLSPGVKSRIAPHRLYNKMAARFVALGYRVLRFDFHGLGDSEGQVQEPFLADLYGSIQSGRYADDTLCALEWMRRDGRVDRVILTGLCGGAITGVFAGAEHPAVAGLIGLGLPVILQGSRIDKVKTMTRGQLGSVRQRYLRKVFSPESWVRILTLKTDFRLLAKALAMQANLASSSSAPAGREGADDANPQLPEPFFRLLASRPMLLIFSGSDRLYAEYQEKFVPRHRSSLSQHSERLELAVVENANHIFTFSEWQEEMLDRSCAWLQHRFPAADVPTDEPLTSARIPVAP
jgi:pimeloyl-ACP methyl ester carboxylesterase